MLSDLVTPFQMLLIIFQDRTASERLEAIAFNLLSNFYRTKSFKFWNLLETNAIVW